MKVLNTIITVCFVVVFSGAAYFTTERMVVVDPSAAVAPAPTAPGSDDVFAKSTPKYKSLPTVPGEGSIMGEEMPIKEPKLEYKKPYVAPAPAPVPPATAMIKEETLTKNEYVRGGIGAVIGWIVKHICELLLGVIKKLSFIKSLGW